MNSEQCETKGCSKEYQITYLGKKLCADCWEEECEPKTENNEEVQTKLIIKNGK